MTPLAFAQAIRDDLNILAVPKPVLAQLGDIIVDCEGTWVSVSGLSQQDLVPGASHCGTVDMADVQIVAAFACSITSDETGITDPTLLANVAAKHDALSEVLVGYVRDLIAKTIVESTINGVQYQNQGGLGFVQIGFTTPIP